MNSIFEYLEYRCYLQDHFNYNKERFHFFSYRYISLKTGLDAGFYVKVLQKQKHIADKAIPILAEFFGLNKKELEYFSTLVHFNKAKRSDQEKYYFEKLLSMRMPAAKMMEKNTYDYFSSWWNIAIREELNIHPFKDDYDDLAARILPSITPAQAQKSIKLLEELGLISKGDDGFYRITEKFVTTDGLLKAVAVKTFQKEVCRLGMEALERIPKGERDISTLTISTSRDCLELIRERMSVLRREIMEMAGRENKVDEVYQINFQIFPLSRNASREEK